PMSTIFGRCSNLPVRTGGANIICGKDGNDALSGGDGHNFAVRAVATASIAFALSVSLVAMTWAQTATAAPPKLKGDYGFTGTAACLSTAALGPGFNPNLTPTDGSFGQSFTSEGIRTFNGDGTGTVKGSHLWGSLSRRTSTARGPTISVSRSHTR